MAILNKRYLRKSFVLIFHYLVLEMFMKLLIFRKTLENIKNIF
jgi:hypothetical protein